MKHFYHIYAGGEWQVPVAEHFTTLAEAGFDGDIHAGFVGPADQRATATAFLAAQPFQVTVAAEADEGYEQVTLDALHRWAQTADPDEPALYAHTKGAGFGTSNSDSSRQSMDYCQVYHWRERVKSLESGEYDAVGCHWLTPEQFPHIGPVPFFAGNYWWARAGYLASLGPPSCDDRYQAERWIGTGSPRILDTAPPVMVRWDETWNRFRYYCRPPGT